MPQSASQKMPSRSRPVQAFWASCLAIVFALSAAACGGGGGGDSGSSSSSSTTTTTSSVSTSTLASSLSFPNTVGSYRVTDAQSFTIGANPISFALYIVGAGAGTVSFHSLTSPEGSSVDLSHLICYSGEQFCSLLMPYKPSVSVTAGSWSYQLRSTSSSPAGFSVQMAARTGSTPTSTSLTIQPYLTTSTYGTASLSTALEGVRSIASQNGISATVNSISQLSNSYSYVNASFTDSTTSALVSTGAADVVNVFFVEGLTGSSSGALGISPGIPGSLGITGANNGLLVSLSAHVSGGSVDTALMAETVAHEMGHFLGLYHTTDSTGTVFDPIDDTGQCAASAYDSDNDGSLSVTECQGVDGTNLMFWQGSASVTQTTLTSNQRSVLQTTLLAQ